MRVLGSELKRLRKENNLSQEDVASHLHIIRQTYSHYETGRIMPPIENLYSLAALYDVPIEYLFGLEKHGEGKEYILTDQENELIHFYRNLDDRDREDVLLFAKIKKDRDRNS